MKRIFLLLTLCIATLTVSAQYYMQVWNGNMYTEFETLDVDSVTFMPSPNGLPYITPVDGKVVVAVHFAVEPCNDVLATGDFVNAAWGDSTKVKFKPLRDGWYTTTIEFVDAASYVAENFADDRAQIKPVQLQTDGSFSWDGQWYGDGDKHVEVVKGKGCYLLYTPSNGESQLVFTDEALGQVIYVKAYNWKVNPCVDLPVAEEAWIKHASVDDAENWVAEKMDKIADGVFTHTFVYSDNGVNIGIDESCAGWYAPENIDGLDETAMAGKTIKVTFVSTSGTKGSVKAELVEEGTKDTTIVEDSGYAFSVSDSKKVTFAPGNLQYIQSTNTWRFADNQYDMLGENNIKNGALADTIDLLGWSTNNTVTPWGVSLSTNDADYSGDFVDWGTNIGDGSTWRTLSTEEWAYLFNTRSDASSKCGVARINLSDDGSQYANGVILLPDSWTCPSAVIFQSGNHSSEGSEYFAEFQTFSISQWKQLEQAGAVFLPATGYRYGTCIDVQLRGDYWSSTLIDTDNAYDLFFNSNNVGLQDDGRRSSGQAVRLVKDYATEQDETPKEDEEPKDSVEYSFSVSSSSQIVFASGNLRYIQSTSTWCFADNQYDILGEANVSNDALADTIDLFGWNGNSTTSPWGINTSLDNSDYSGNFLDWGKNIGDGNTWRTLNNDEWNYLFNIRTNASSLYGRATINNGTNDIVGIILLPDTWSIPAGVTFSAGNSTWAKNTYTLEQWQQMEQAGAVFFPAAGLRKGASICDVQSRGNYWSSPLYSEENAYNFNFGDGDINPTGYNYCFEGRAVRLVRDCNSSETPTEPTPATEVEVLNETLLTQTSFDKFTAVNISGDQAWSLSTSYGASMSGYNNTTSATEENEDWLISPAMDLTGKSSATLTFNHAFGPKSVVPSTDETKAQYTIWVSNDYNGDIATATWTQLEGMTYGTTGWGYVSSGELAIPTANLTTNCRIAWKYVCTTVSATWEIKEVVVKSVE